MDIHERFMQRAIELAQQGLGHTRANPLVGCVIVHQNRIIGEGYHHQYGGAHAEIVAINSVKNRNLLPESTMYVTLEPCAHVGKTPPCSQTITSERIPRVFIAATDPNPLVNHKGIEALSHAGVLVKTGLCEKPYRFVNRRFFTFFEKRRPYIILKWAQSNDGFLSPYSSSSSAKNYWISNQTNKVLVHKWRSEEMAILVGSHTIVNDNPQLTVRLWKGQHPLRVFIQNQSPIPKDAEILNTPPETIRFTANPNINDYEHIQSYVLNRETFLEEMLHKLFELNILSLIVEGGSFTLQQFIDQNLWDEARIITGNILFKQGIKAPSIQSKRQETFQIDNDLLTILYNLDETY
jgi:diaminohydroxyphosphoribosylaminopyrimidine deaminase/5-amino-6-(5-phosphoribosylamino)uracil reductase